MSGQSFWFKRVKWEMPSCSEEHFRDGWRCKEAVWWSWVEHWSSEAHQYYSPCPFGIVGTGGTGSFLKPLWAFFTGEGKFWLLLETSPAAPCSICVGQDMCGWGCYEGSATKIDNFSKEKKANFTVFVFFRFSFSLWRNVHFLSLWN